MNKIDEIRAREQAATPGPWYWEEDLLLTTYETHLVMKPFHDDDTYETSTCVMPYDADFIAAAREDTPYLLSEIERLTAERDVAVAEIPESCANCFSLDEWPHGSRCKNCDEHSKWQWCGLIQQP